MSTMATVVERSIVIFDRFSGYLNTLVIALVILLAGFIFGRIIDRVLYRAFLRIGFDDWCFSVFGRRRNYARSTRTAIVYAIYVLTAYFALQELRLDHVAFTFVIGLLVLIVLVSFVLAGVEFVPSLIGRWQLRKRNISPGDTVELQDDTGKIKAKVIELSILDLRLKRSNGDVFFYPTAMLQAVKIRRLRR